MNVSKIKYKHVEISETKIDNSLWIHSTRWIMETLNNLFYNGAWLWLCRISHPWTGRLRDINKEIYMMNSRMETPSWPSITEYSPHMRSIHYAANRSLHTFMLTNTHNPCNSEGWFLHHKRKLNGKWERLRALHTTQFAHWSEICKRWWFMQEA